MTAPLIQTYGAHARATLTLGLPLIGSHLAQMSLHVVDTIMLGWYSVEALAAGVLGASLADLQGVAGIGESAALDLKLLHEAAIRQGRAGLRKRTVISSWAALLGYVRVMLASEVREQFRVLFLDKKNQLIADEQLGQGTVDHAPVYPREVMRRALELSASSLILRWPSASVAIAVSVRTFMKR